MVRSLLRSVPESSRAALGWEAVSSIGSGAYLALFSISLVVLEDVLDAQLHWQALLAALFFGSNFVSPLVPWFGRFVPMQSLVVVPNLLIGLLLISTAIAPESAAVFTAIVGVTFAVRCLPRVGEMNLYKVFYPDECRGRAVGILRSIAGLSMLLTTLLSWVWLGQFASYYYLLYGFIGLLVITSAVSYARIPVPHIDRGDLTSVAPTTMFVRGARAFFEDRRFLTYQAGFATAGVANHIGLFLVPKVLSDSLGVTGWELSLLVVVLPALILILTAPVLGKWLDGRTPMFARGSFNVLQTAAYLGYAAGGLTGDVVWFYLATVAHAISNGGGLVNWLTGSLYFAAPERVSLYNTIHVGLTGVRGMIGPVVGYLLFSSTITIGGASFSGAGWGPHVWLLCASLSVAGTAVMFLLERSERRRLVHATA